MTFLSSTLTGGCTGEIAMHYLRLFLVVASLITLGRSSALAQDAPGAATKDMRPGEALKEDSKAPAEQPFFRWMDNSITVLPYGWNYKVDPSAQSTSTFEHAHESAIGDLFFFVDVTGFHHRKKGADEWNWFGELSPRFSLGKIFSKDLSFTLFRHSLFEIKDVLIAGQYERGKDADKAEAALLGIGLDLDVREAGILGRLGKFNYVQLNIYGRAELTNDQRHGLRDMQITMVAAYPFEIGSSRFLIDGYFDWVLGIGPEQSSFHFNPQIKLDVGNYWGKREKFYVGVEPDFWWNKFQIKSTRAFDTNQQAISLLLKYHF